MIHNEAAQRYAAALFEAAKEVNVQDKILEELRAAHKAFSSEELNSFFASKGASEDEKAKALLSSFDKLGWSELFKSFLTVLTKNNRTNLVSEIAIAYQSVIDASNGITRGVVKSASPLSPDDRKKLEEKISTVIKKKIILEYKEDKSLIGGLVAQVGSYSFDDTLETQLSLLNEELKRRAH